MSVGVGMGVRDGIDLWTWTPTLMPDWHWPGVGRGRGEQQVVKVGGGGVGCTVFPVFDVNTGHLAQVEATVYVFLFLICRGEFPVIFFGGRGSFV